MAMAGVHCNLTNSLKSFSFPLLLILSLLFLSFISSISEAGIVVVAENEEAESHPFPSSSFVPSSSSLSARVAHNNDKDDERPLPLSTRKQHYYALTKPGITEEWDGMRLTQWKEDNGLGTGDRVKRDLTSTIFDAAGSLGVGEKYIKKFRTLVQGVPPKMQDALLSQDFSNVTADDMRALNISVIEYLPPNVISKLNLNLLTPVVERLLQANRPMAMGRVMSAMGETMDSNTLLDKLKEGGGLRDATEESGSIMLHTALSKVGDKGGLDGAMVGRLVRERLIDLVPEEQLMKVKDSEAAKYLLDRMYATDPNAVGATSGSRDALTDIDDEALVYKLTETAYGKPESWSGDVVSRLIGPSVMSQLPAQALKDMDGKAVQQSIHMLSQTKFENPMQGKAIADLFNSSVGGSPGKTLSGIVSQLGPLAAFIDPSKVDNRESSVFGSIVQGCSSLNLPAPLKAVTERLKQFMQVGRAKSVDDLGHEDFRQMSGALLKNAPPSWVSKAMETRSLSPPQLLEISNTGDAASHSKGLFSHPFFKGMLAQVSAYATQVFTGGNVRNIRALPGAFLGALGIHSFQRMNTHDLLYDVVGKLRENPDALDDTQKAILLKRLRDEGLLDSVDLPPEIRALLPRPKKSASHKHDDNDDDLLKGLPSESELRLAHGWGRKLTAVDLEKDPLLVGTLTPKQVMDMDLEEIPAVLGVVRKSKDGPQQQTLKELSRRFAEYIRLKAEDYESPDKKLLKYVSGAEVAKLPATVLAYFIDGRQTSKLPPDVRKEIMIAMGELSTKDHASIPAKTREEIIRQGLAAIDKLTGGSNSLDVPELAAIGGGVADLPPSRIASLTPVATELALSVIQGSADDDDDGLKQRACLSKEQKGAWRSKVIQLYGEPAKWDAPTVMSLCCILGLLDKKDLSSMAPEALATCVCRSDTKPPSHLQELKKGLDANCKHEKGEDSSAGAKDMVEKVKSEIVFDLDDLESQILTRRRRDAVPESADDVSPSSSESANLNCYKIRLTGSAAPFSKKQLESLSEDEVGDCLYELGLEPLSLEHARVLWSKLVDSKAKSSSADGVEGLTASDVRFAGHVLSGIRLSDIKTLNLRDWDIVSQFGKTEGLAKTVWEKLAARLEEEQRKELENFDSNELVMTKNILCGFTPQKLGTIQSHAFRDALPVLKTIHDGCEQSRVSALAAIAMRPDVFGSDLSTWSPADVRGVGIFLTGLPLRLVETLPPESFLGVSPTVSASLPPLILSTLTPEQVAYLPAFSAQAISSGQRGQLSEGAKSEFDKLVRGPVAEVEGGGSASSSTKLSPAMFILGSSVLVELLVSCTFLRGLLIGVRIQGRI